MSKFNMDYDKNDAVIADGGNYIKKSGVYFGTINKAVVKESENTDAWAVEIELLTDDQELVKSTLWVANKDGHFTYIDKKTGKEEKLPSYKIFIGIFAVLGIDKIIAQTSQATGAAGYTQLFGKKVGFAIQREEKENNSPNAQNPTYWQNNIKQIFNYQTKKSLAESNGNKEATAYKREWEDKPMTANGLDYQSTPIVNDNKEHSYLPF